MGRDDLGDRARHPNAGGDNYLERVSCVSATSCTTVGRYLVAGSAKTLVMALTAPEPTPTPDPDPVPEPDPSPVIPVFTG